MYIDVSHVIPKIDASRPGGNRYAARGYRRAYQCANDPDCARKRSCYAYYSVNCIYYSSSNIQYFNNADNNSAKSCANAYCATNSRGNDNEIAHARGTA